MTVELVLVTGNTYPVKEELKAIGAKWDAINKGWKVPADKVEKAKQIVARGATAATPQVKTYNGPKKCCACGVVQQFNKRGYPNVQIYKSGECQDCFEERKMGY